MERNSASGLRRNLRRAGTFSKSSRTLMVVPQAPAGEGIAFDLGGRAAVVAGGDEGEAGDGSDRGEGLAAEAEGAHVGEIVEAGDLGGGVTLDGQQSVVFAHAAAVVAHLDPLPAARLEDHIDGGGPGVDGVLDQLLDGRGGTFDDFSRGDLVHEIGGKEVDAGHHRFRTERRPGRTASCSDNCVGSIVKETV
jgi:hypothetical protein